MTTALVTGGARSIGGAISKRLAELGYSVAVHGRTDRPEIRAFLDDLPGGPHCAVFGDIADPEAARRLVEDAVEALGHIDVLVNNAGIYVQGALGSEDFTAWKRQWDDIFATNVFGTAHVTFAAVEHFLSRPTGPAGARIVNVGSRGAYRGEPDAPAYGASKAAVHSLTQSLAKSLATHGIGVAAVAPGFIDTDLSRAYLAGPAGDAVRAQSPFGRVGLPEEVASAVVWLVSPDSLWSSGAVIDVNGASYFR